MSTHLLGPETLRSKAWQLRSHAASVSAALDHADSEIRGLNSDTFTGLRADNMRRRYEAQRQQLVDIPDLLTGFAQSLEQAAEFFEQTSTETTTQRTFHQPSTHQAAHQLARRTADSLSDPRWQSSDGIPRWTEWGRDPWQTGVQPLANTAPNLLTTSPGMRPAAQPESCPADAEAIRPIDHPILTQAYQGEHHPGIDLTSAAALGAPIYASYAGTVVFTRKVNTGQIQPIRNADGKLTNPELSEPKANYGYGNALIVEYHLTDQSPGVQAAWKAAGVQETQSVYALYAHLNSINRQVGEAVNPGAEIAQMGQDGICNGPHLHLEVRLGHPDTMKLPGSGWSTLPSTNPLKIFKMIEALD